MTTIKEMIGMGVLCSDKTGTLTLNKLTIDKSHIEVFVKGINADTVVLMAVRKRFANQIMTTGQKVTFEYHGNDYIFTVNQATVEGQE